MIYDSLAANITNLVGAGLMLVCLVLLVLRPPRVSRLIAGLVFGFAGSALFIVATLISGNTWAWVGVVGWVAVVGFVVVYLWRRRGGLSQ